MRFSWRSEWPHLLLLAGMLVLAAMNWSTAPDRIPVHFGFSGQPDRYGGRAEGLLSMPLIAIGMYLLLLLLPRIDPGRANYPAFSHTYATLRLAVLVMIAVIDVLVLVAMRSAHVDVNVWISLVVGGLLVVVGNLLGKVRPNWFVGVRTPWTLSSKLSWTRTNRLGGWLFIVGGVLMMGLAPVRSPWGMLTVVGVMGIGVLGLVVYSYVLWKNDPDKVPPAGTLPG